ncbi:MAG: hypothetical protein KA264_04460 [Crocinitomicaceae bacterium]|jgi:hypothetical protein|nr:hypothetical protein [Crocinitomicaceae bacterium]
MLSIKVLSNNNHVFLKNLPTNKYVEITPFPKEEEQELQKGIFQDDLHAVIINQCNVYFNIICTLIKKRIPIFLFDFYNLPLDKAKTLLDLSEEAASYVQVKSSNRFIFKEINYWSFIENPQLISITRSFDINQNDDIIEIIYLEIENIIAILKSKPRKISPIQILEKTEDIQTIDFRIEFDNGAILKMTISSVLPEKTHTLEFIKWNNYQKIDLINCTYTSNKEIEKFIKTEDPKSSEVLHFCSNLLYNKLPEVNIEDGLITIELIDKIIY